MFTTTMFFAVSLLTVANVVYAASCPRRFCNGLSAAQANTIQTSSADVCGCTCSGGGNILHAAARSACQTCIQVLIGTRGCPVNPTDNSGNTPLHVAAGQCDELVTQDLLGQEANVNAVNNDGDMPICLAARGSSGGCVTVVSSLLANGADVCTFCSDILLYFTASQKGVLNLINGLGGTPENCLS